MLTVWTLDKNIVGSRNRIQTTLKINLNLEKRHTNTKKENLKTKRLKHNLMLPYPWIVYLNPLKKVLI